MCKTDELSDSARSGEIFKSPYPSILMAGDNVRLADLTSRTLIDEGFAVHMAAGYHSIGDLWHRYRHPVILLDVSSLRAVDSAVMAALGIKRLDPSQFIGYLADPILRTSGLAGDAIFPRNLRQLPAELRKHFDSQRMEEK